MDLKAVVAGDEELRRLDQKQVGLLLRFLGECCVRGVEPEAATLYYLTYDTGGASIRAAFGRWLGEQGDVYGLPGPRSAAFEAFRRLISLQLAAEPCRFKHRYHGVIRTAWRGYRFAEGDLSWYSKAMSSSEPAVQPVRERGCVGSPSNALTTPSGCSCSQEAGNVALPAGSTPYVPAAKRRCLGALPKDLSTLTFSEEEVAASNGYRPQPSDFERSMMVRPHKDLLRVEADTSEHNTFVLALCAEEGCAEGWALGVESAVIPGFGGLMSLFDGCSTAALHGDLKDVAYLALTLVKAYQQTLRRWLGVTDPSQGTDLLAPKLDVRLRISPSLYPRTGSSIGAAILVSLMALATGLSARKDVAVTGSLDLRGQLEPVDWLLPKARAAATAGATALVLPYDCPMPNDESNAPVAGPEQEVELNRAVLARDPATQQEWPLDDGKRTHLGGVELRRVRDMWDLALATLSPLPASAPPKPLTTDNGCYVGQATCGTHVVQERELSTYLQVIQCLVYVSGYEPVVTGLAGHRAIAACNSAVAWLYDAWATRLQGAVRWESMEGLSFHFHLAPLGVASTEMHLGPTIYMALVSAATGWRADPKVSIFAEVTMHGGVLKLTEKPTRLDMAIMWGLEGMQTWVVPEGAKGDFEEAWRQAHGETDRAVRFVGIRSIWEALPIVFPADYVAWKQSGQRAEE